MKSLAVYCGSNYGNNPLFKAGAEALGAAMAKQGITLVYGGGSIGLMGTVADAVLAGGGQVIGVIPTFLKDKEMGHQGLTELIEMPDMASRKLKMMALADGYIAMPGGLGTFEELFEVLSAAQLRLHAKPTGLLNVAGFFEPMLQCIKTAVDERFMPEANMSLMCVSDQAEELLRQMAAYAPVYAPKWVNPPTENVNV